jgi:crotonobetainyl-CoA:carnitine CoA-transferase CaiB-like acyl-CoA transferase
MFGHLKVLELASVLAGPVVGQFFAELGAEVIKVENMHTGGDVTRSWKGEDERTDDRSAYFCSCNWGKKSIALDLLTDQGNEIVRKLAIEVDMVIASYKPGDAEKLGVSYEQLKRVNPRIIYGQITGYGKEDARVGYDAVIQAESGFMDLNGERDGAPMKMPVALIDVLAAHHLKEGLLLALWQREKTGKGTCVEVSLIQAAVASLANQATNWLVAGKRPTRQGSLHPNIAPYGESFQTKDGKRILLAIGNDRQFVDLLSVLSLQELEKDTRYKTNQQRVKHRQSLSESLKDAIENQEATDLMQKMHRHNIPAGIIQNVKEVFEMYSARQLLLSNRELAGVSGLAFQLTGYAFKNNSVLPPPHLGEHTEEILDRLNK